MNISFGYGIHRTPTLGEDGELTECVNLIPEHGELVNIQPPKKIGITVDKDTEELIAIHETSTFKHYIVKVSGTAVSLAYFTEEDATRHTIECEYASGFKGIETIGNTIIIITDSGICYHLWKNGKYVNLGQRPPFLDMSFGLTPHYDDITIIQNDVNVKDLSTNLGYYSRDGAASSTGVCNYFTYQDKHSDGDASTQQEKNEALRDKISTALTGIADEAKNEQKGKERFTDSFFVRYAYRTYNGSMMISTPILMTPTYGDQIIAMYPNYSSGVDGVNVYKFNACSMSCGFSLFYQLPNSSEIKSKLADWSDIITGVDIFVSSQITRYKSSGKFKGAGYYGYKPWETESGGFSTFTDFPSGMEKPEIYDFQYSIGKSTSCITKDIGTIKCAEYDTRQYGYEDKGFWVALGFRKKDDEFYKEIEETSNFYKFKFIEVKDLANSKIIEPETGTLNSLEARETLKDEIYSNDTFMPSIYFIYNRRLNIADIKLKLHSFVCPSMFQFTNTEASWELDETENDYVLKEGDNDSTYDYELYLKIHEGETSMVVHNTSGLQLHESPHYLYYPNSHVSKGLLVRTDYKTKEVKYAELVFKQHKMLTGSYWFDQFSGLSYDSTATIPSGEDTIIYQNMIFVSEVNNPFVFETTNMASVGSGKILGVSTANKALSGGTEFGVNPLLCFCSDGIWPMSVSSDGTYSSVKPLTRDVVTNADAILQLDDAVAFITKRGLMVTDGSENGTGLISEFMHGKNIDETRLKGLMATHDSLIIADTEDFVTMVQSCQMMFDYAHQLIHIYPANNIGKHFVYSLTSKEFSSYAGSDADIVTNVPGYPLSTIQLTDGSLAQYETSTDFTTTRYGVLLTRPTALGNPYAMKNIADLRLSYSRNVDGTKCLIQPYVSNDRKTWFAMSSLRAHSYKWYRFAVFTKMCDIDGLEGLTLQENTVRNNKIR